MSHYTPVINAFIEDTCVLMVIAYLLARGRMLDLLFPERPTRHRDMVLGFLMGLVGLTEVIFPGARAPYVTHTLIVTFATLIGGLPVGLIAAATVVLGVGIFQAPPGVFETFLTMSASVLLSEAVRRLFGTHYRLLRGLVAGMFAQASVVLLHLLPAGEIHAAHSLAHAFISVPANGFGILLLQMILEDARTRADSERHRLEAERAQALIAEAQLTALRARMHPHFLFNALTSIAALCGLAPDRAESATLRLSQLMRRALETNPTVPICLAEEIEYVRGYLEIEQQRLGQRLQVSWEVTGACDSIPVPAFALQTLAENAVIHGIGPRMEPGQIRIVVRVRPHYTLIAVKDNGVGMTPSERAGALRSDDERGHGLQIATQQLTLLYGHRARLRLFSRPDAGTVAAFAVPNTGLFAPGESVYHAHRSDRRR